MLYATYSTCGAAAADALYVCREGMLALVHSLRVSCLDASAAFLRLIERPKLPVPAARILAPEPAVLGVEGQWARATGVIRSALTSFRNIQTFQATAARQIDAADYALQLLTQDLSAAMPIPADGRALRAVLAEAAKTPAPAARPKKALAA